MSVIPKFHDRSSLWVGVGAGVMLLSNAILSIWGMKSVVINVIQGMIGLSLSIHCLDMIKYYREHRIVRIVKTDTERVIYKDGNKLRVWGNGLRFAWKQPSLRLWLVLCSVGIFAGLFVGIGMTNLVLLVALACLGWGMEVANTSIETLLDIVNPRYSEKVKIVKDCFAAVPIFVFSAYVISWLILVGPSLIRASYPVLAKWAVFIYPSLARMVLN